MSTINQNQTESQTDDDRQRSDPSQVMLPARESKWQWHGRKIHDLKYGIPGGLFAVLSGTAWVFGLPWQPAVGGSLVGLLVAVIGIALSSTADEYETAYDRVYKPIRRRLNMRSMPWSQAVNAERPQHGVESITHDGTVELSDGRVMAMARMEGRNTDLQELDETQRMLGSLRNGLDERMADQSFRMFSTTTDFDTDGLAQQYFDLAYSKLYEATEWRPLRRLLEHFGEFTRVKEDQWKPNYWKHYIVVFVKEWHVEDRVAGNDEDALKRAQHREAKAIIRKNVTDGFGRIPDCPAPEMVGPVEMASVLSRYWSGHDHPFSKQDVTKETRVSVFPDTRRQRPENTDTKGVHQPDAVANDPDASPTDVADVAEPYAVASDGGDTATVDPVQTDQAVTPDDETTSRLAQLREDLLGPLGGRDDDDDDAGSLPHQRSAVSTRPIQDALAASQYALQSDGCVQVGDELVKTVWIADWPVQPDEMFMRRLYTLRDVNVDVCIDVKARDTDATRGDIEEAYGGMGADVDEERDRSDLGHRDIITDQEAYVQMFDLLKDGRTNAWDICGYVTVRVDSKRAFEHTATSLIRRGAANMSADEIAHSLGDVLGTETSRYDGASHAIKRFALERDVETVTNALEDAPADLTIHSDDELQSEMFRGASPNGPNVYADVSSHNRWGLGGTGTLAAMFPPGSMVLQEDDGVFFGRNMQNGSLIRADPFNRGKAPHMLGIGDSGSGKTTFALTLGEEWVAMDPDNTLIVCDTFGDFDWLVETFNGEHIVVGGRQTINPLHIEPTHADGLDANDIDPYGLKSDEVAQFLKGIIRAQGDGVQAGQFDQLIKDILRWTYSDFGIYPNDIESHANPSPQMGDFIDKLQEVSENADDYTMSSSEDEQMVLKQNCGQLLRKLSGFQDDREYAHLVGDDDTAIQHGGVTYLDLQQMEGKGEIVNAAMLQLMLSKVYESVKASPGKTIFLIDEAHYLLHSEEMIEWLQRACRHWRHHDAALAFFSQRPAEFVSGDDDEDKQKETIRTQCATKIWFPTEGLDKEPEVYRKFGLNERQAHFVANTASTGSSSGKFSQGLLSFKDKPGWLRTQVEVPPLLLHAMDYDRNDHGDFEQYLLGTRGQSLPSQSNTENTTDSQESGQ